MLNQEEVRQAIRVPLLDAEIIPDKSYSWQGKGFNPTGKCVWIRETMLTVTEISASQNNEEFSGIMVFDVFVPSGSGTEAMGANAKAVADVYDPTDPESAKSLIAGDGFNVIIDRVERLTMQKDDSWQWIPVYIYFRAVN